MGEILLVAADWKMRALVRAQLLEEGFQVQAWPSVAPALASLLRGGPPPSLAILDCESTGADAQASVNLWQATRQAPLLLCAGLLARRLLAAPGFPPARLLMRPFRVGDIVEQVREMLA